MTTLKLLFLMLLMSTSALAGGLVSTGSVNIESNAEGLSGAYLIAVWQSSENLNEVARVFFDTPEGKIPSPIEIRDQNKRDYQIYETTSLEVIPKISVISINLDYDDFVGLFDYDGRERECNEAIARYYAQTGYQGIRTIYNAKYSSCDIVAFAQTGIEGYTSSLRKGEQEFSVTYSITQSGTQKGTVSISNTKSRDVFGQNDVIVRYLSTVNLPKTSKIPSANDAIGVYTKNKQWIIAPDQAKDSYLSRLNAMRSVSTTISASSAQVILNEYNSAVNALMNEQPPASFRDQSIIKKLNNPNTLIGAIFKVELQPDVLGHQARFFLKGDHVGLFVPSGRPTIDPISPITFSESQDIATIRVTGRNIGQYAGSFEISGRCQSKISIVSTGFFNINAGQTYTKNLIIKGFNPQREEQIRESCTITVRDQVSGEEATRTFQATMNSAASCQIGETSVRQEERTAYIITYTSEQCAYTEKACNLDTKEVRSQEGKLVCVDKDSPETTCEPTLGFIPKISCLSFGSFFGGFASFTTIIFVFVALIVSVIGTGTANTLLSNKKLFKLGTGTRWSFALIIGLLFGAITFTVLLAFGILAGLALSIIALFALLMAILR